MNKFYTLLLLSGAAITANAQQISGSFDGDWNDCTPWTSDGNTKVVGTQPKGWHISNVYASGTKTIVGESVEGTEGEGTVAVKLTNKSVVGQEIPGYITLGTPWATAETWFMSVRNADGGTYGGLKFTYHPDAISFDYKRDNSNGDENATVVAYIWNGTWTQKNVPGNTSVGYIGYGNAKKVDMTDRDRNILGKETATGGDITYTDGATLVASLEQTLASTAETTTDEETGAETTVYNWKNVTIPFTYTKGNESAKVENLNVIFSATDYFGDRNNIVAGNSLTIDNVKLVYYHSLSSLTATDNMGNDVELNFSPDVYNYNVNSTYDSDWTEVSYEKVGVGASVDAKYNEETAQYVITVKGEDYDIATNPEAVTVYTIQYVKPAKAPKLNSLVVGGHDFISAGNEDTEFTASGVYCPGEISYGSEEEEINVESEYDEKTGILTLTVTNGDNTDVSTVYTITFEGNKKDAVYQIPNSDFEDWTTDGKLATGWNSFDTAAGLFASFGSMSPMPEKIEGLEGNGVRLHSVDLWVAYANGNMTTGHINMGSINPADASNFNFTDRTDVNGNLPFAGTPDAFEVYARFTPGTATDEATALNGRVQLLLHSDAAYHDPELEEMAGSKIASASVIIPVTEEWTKFAGEFNYVGDVTDNMFMLASATTNPVPGASKDDKLDLDNLKLIYYSTLADLTFDGKTIEGFAENKTVYHVDAFIDDAIDKLDYAVKGKGATAVVVNNMEKGIVTIRVNGGDYDVNPSNVTEYTIYFDKTTGIGSISADAAASHKVYTVDGTRVSGKPAAGLYIVDGKKTMIK